MLLQPWWHYSPGCSGTFDAPFTPMRVTNGADGVPRPTENAASQSQAMQTGVAEFARRLRRNWSSGPEGNRWHPCDIRMRNDQCGTARRSLVTWSIPGTLLARRQEYAGRIRRQLRPRELLSRRLDLNLRQRQPQDQEENSAHPEVFANGYNSILSTRNRKCNLDCQIRPGSHRRRPLDKF